MVKMNGSLMRLCILCWQSSVRGRPVFPTSSQRLTLVFEARDTDHICSLMRKWIRRLDFFISLWSAMAKCPQGKMLLDHIF